MADKKLLGIYISINQQHQRVHFVSVARYPGTISHLAKITPQWLWQNYSRVCHILIGLHEDKILRAYDLQQADKLEVDDRTKF